MIKYNDLAICNYIICNANRLKLKINYFTFENISKIKKKISILKRKISFNKYYYLSCSNYYPAYRENFKFIEMFSLDRAHKNYLNEILE